MYELSDLEKEKVDIFVKDEVMFEAVKKVLLAAVYSNGTLRKDKQANPTQNAALMLAFLATSGQGTITDAELGADLRALAHGVRTVEGGFVELKRIKKEEKVVESPYNEAI